jgi:hypothetical protein
MFVGGREKKKKNELGKRERTRTIIPLLTAAQPAEGGLTKKKGGST